MHQTLVAVVFVVMVSFSTLNVLPVTMADSHRTGHEFECGPNEPPSGPYLSLSLMQFYDYDCSTQALSPSTLSADLCHVEIHEGKAIPVAGLCLVLNPRDGGFTPDYNWDAVVSLIGSYPYVNIHTFDDETKWTEVDCSNNEEEMQCGGIPLTNSLVSYWSVYNQLFIDDYKYCTPHVSHGKITAWGPNNFRTEDAVNKVEWCLSG